MTVDIASPPSATPRSWRAAATVAALLAMLLIAVGCESTRPVAEATADEGDMTFEHRSFARGAVSFDAPVAADGATLGLYSGAYVHKQAIRTRMNLLKGNTETSAFAVATEPLKPGKHPAAVQVDRTTYLYNAGSGHRREAHYYDTAQHQIVTISIDTRPGSPQADVARVAARREADDAVFHRILSSLQVQAADGSMVRAQIVERSQGQEDERGIQGSAGGKYFRKEIPVVTAESSLVPREFLDGAVTVLMPPRKDEANMLGCLYGVALYTEHTGRISGHWRISSVSVFVDREPVYWPMTAAGQPWTSRVVKNETPVSRTVTRSAYIHDPASGQNLAIRVITDHPPAPLVDPGTFDRRVAEDDLIFDRIVASIQLRE